ncbi:helix-turn-helix transcriptional regulator [Oleiphilus messinensis]|nr:AraC family transcriptional regulator [Oleiphilus messinensis]
MFIFGPRDKVFDFRYFPPLLTMAQEEGVDVEALLAGTNIPESALSLENYKASAEQLEALMQNVLRLCRPGITLEFGSRLNLSAFGIVGFAALSSPTARDAIYIAHQYMPVILPILDISITEQTTNTYIDLRLNYPMEDAIGIALLEATLASLYTMANFVLHDAMPEIRLEISHDLKPYHEAFAQSRNVTIKGGCSQNRAIIPTKVLDVPLPLADSTTFSMSVKQCDELMEELAQLDQTLGAGIQRRLLYHDGEEMLTQEDIARELFMSVRTLHRLLQREGTTFRQIANETLTLRAKRMLEQSDQSVSQIATELGYSDSANFTRAFRNQTGATPSEYRKAFQARQARHQS